MKLEIKKFPIIFGKSHLQEIGELAESIGLNKTEFIKEAIDEKMIRENNRKKKQEQI